MDTRKLRAVNTYVKFLVFGVGLVFAVAMFVYETNELKHQTFHNSQRITRLDASTYKRFIHLQSTMETLRVNQEAFLTKITKNQEDIKETYDRMSSSLSHFVYRVDADNRTDKEAFVRLQRDSAAARSALEATLLGVITERGTHEKNN